MNGREQHNEILIAFALGALSEPEARQIAAQVSADEALAIELEMWREIAAHLACHAPAVEPSPECRAKVLASIKNAPLHSDAAKPSSFLTNDGHAPAQSSAAFTSNVVNFQARSTPRTFWSYMPSVAAVAASIVAVLLGIALFNSVRSNQVMSQQLADLQQRVERSEQQLNQVQTQSEQRINGLQAQLERKWQEPELLASANSVEIQLTGTANSPEAKARLVLDRQTGRAMLFVENLPPAPEGKVYQVWFIADPKNPFPGAVFSTNTSGKATFRDNMPAESLKASVFAVTVEPEGGSLNPTTKPFLINPTL